MSAAVPVTISACFVRNTPTNKKFIPDNLFIVRMHNTPHEAVIPANQSKEYMRLIRHEDNLIMNQDLLFSRLQKIIPPHRRNDSMQAVNEAVADKQNEQDFQSRLNAALSAARAFHRNYFFE